MSFPLDDFADLSEDERSALRYLSFEELTADPTPFPGHGDVIDDFVVGDRIGSGAAGVVYRARQRSVDRDVALKLVPADALRLDDAERERVAREARILGELRHESLIPVYGAGVTPGFHYVAMMLVDGVSLSRYLAAEVPGSERIATVLFQVASALATAHTAGVVHRDVKPDNVLVTSDDRAFLVDFGLARPAHTTGATVTSGFVGTLRFASPEQTRGDHLTAHSDVFSFGVMAFDALTGRVPFAEREPHALVDAIRYSQPTWPRDADVGRELAAIVDRCLEKAPADRYASANELTDDLRRYLAGEPVDAVKRSSLSRAWRSVLLRPRRALIALAALMLVALASFAVDAAMKRRADVEALERDALYVSADSAFHRGDFAAAVATIERLTDGTGEAPPGAYATLGDIELVRQILSPISSDFSEARRFYEREIEATGGSQADRMALTAIASLERRTAPDQAPTTLPATARGRVMSDLAEWADGTSTSTDGIDGVLASGSSYPWLVLRALIRRTRFQHREAVEDLMVARSFQPLDVPTLLAHSDSLRVLGRERERYALMRAATELLPAEPWLLGQLASSGLVIGRDREDMTAIAARAFDLAPSDPLVAEHYASALMVDGLDEEAIEVVAPHLDGPRRISCLVTTASALRRLKRIAEALVALDRVLADPLTKAGERVKALGLKSQIAWQERRLEDVVDLNERLEVLDPLTVKWPLERGRALAQLKEPMKARLALERAEQLDRQARVTKSDEERVALGYLRGSLESQDGDFEAALVTYQSLLPWTDAPGQVYYLIATTHWSLDDPARGLPFAINALEEYPGWCDAAWLAANLAHVSDQHAIAVPYYEEALAHCTEERIRADYAECLELIGREEEALVAYQATRDAVPDHAPAWCGEGLLRLRSEDEAIRDVLEGQRLLREACLLSPDNSDYAAYLAEADAAVAR